MQGGQAPPPPISAAQTVGPGAHAGPAPPLCACARPAPQRRAGPNHRRTGGERRHWTEPCLRWRARSASIPLLHGAVRCHGAAALNGAACCLRRWCCRGGAVVRVRRRGFLRLEPALPGPPAGRREVGPCARSLRRARGFGRPQAQTDALAGGCAGGTLASAGQGRAPESSPRGFHGPAR